MYLQYGSYQHQLNEAGLAVRRETVFSPDQIAIAVDEFWAVSGFLLADSQADLITAIEALMAAYAIQGQNATLLLSDGVTPTPHQLVSANCLGGVRVTQQPTFLEWQGGELGLFRSYSLALQARIPITNDAAALLLTWEETVNFTGGGPRFVYLETRNGLPIQQYVAQYTTYKVSQTGHALGFLGWPLPAYPIWPTAEHQDQRNILRGTPKWLGEGANAAQTEWPVNWSYQFESALGLAGGPTMRTA